MPSVSSEIIADITEHIGKFGGDFSAWCVGTARDWHSPVLEAHEQEEKNDDFICREAYTLAGARHPPQQRPEHESRLDGPRLHGGLQQGLRVHLSRTSGARLGGAGRPAYVPISARALAGNGKNRLDTAGTMANRQ